MTSLTMVAAVGDETRFAYADVIAPPFKVKESARTRASNNLAILACMARVDQNRSFMSRAWVVADRDEALMSHRKVHCLSLERPGFLRGAWELGTHSL